jgi:soluble lytic murein transglycosylase-like protein
MQAKVVATAKAMGVDPALAQAVAFQESGFNHAVVSPANAIGAMQVIPSSGTWASELVGRPLNLVDPDDNVVAGVAILRSLVKSAPDLPTAIAGYYQGATSVQRNGMFADTRRYVANVQTHMTRFR